MNKQIPIFCCDSDPAVEDLQRTRVSMKSSIPHQMTASVRWRLNWKYWLLFCMCLLISMIFVVVIIHLPVAQAVMLSRVRWPRCGGYISRRERNHTALIGDSASRPHSAVHAVILGDCWKTMRHTLISIANQTVVPEQVTVVMILDATDVHRRETDYNTLQKSEYELEANTHGVATTSTDAQFDSKNTDADVDVPSWWDALVEENSEVFSLRVVSIDRASPHCDLDLAQLDVDRWVEQLHPVLAQVFTLVQPQDCVWVGLGGSIYYPAAVQHACSTVQHQHEDSNVYVGIQGVRLEPSGAHHNTLPTQSFQSDSDGALEVNAVKTFRAKWYSSNQIDVSENVALLMLCGGICTSGATWLQLIRSCSACSDARLHLKPYSALFEHLKQALRETCGSCTHSECSWTFMNVSLSLVMLKMAITQCGCSGNRQSTTRNPGGDTTVYHTDVEVSTRCHQAQNKARLEDHFASMRFVVPETNDPHNTMFIRW